MHVTSLRAVGLRNLDVALGELPVGIVAVEGENGQGKTSLLEAIDLALSGGSFRTRDRALIVQRGSTEAMVSCVVETEGKGWVRIGRRIGVDGSLETRVDGKAVRKLAPLPVVTFEPDDVQIASGGPERRRRFIDGAAVALEASAGSVLRAAERVLRQRTEALRVPEPDDVTLDILEERFAVATRAVGSLRERTVDLLRPFVEPVVASILHADGRVDLAYRPTWDAEGIEAALRASRSEDRRRGATSIGFHRDDVAILLDGAPIREVGSQGQLRTVVVALTVAVARAVEAVRHVRPVLLLDDLLAELDVHRSRGALEVLAGLQAFISHTGEVPGALRVIRLEEGRVRAA
jgi:DNA replication and repair protein RecF